SCIGRLRIGAGVGTGGRTCNIFRPKTPLVGQRRGAACCEGESGGASLGSRLAGRLGGDERRDTHFDSSYIRCVPAQPVRDPRVVLGPRKATRVSKQAETVPGIQRRAAAEQRVRERGPTVIPQRAELGINRGGDRT